MEMPKWYSYLLKENIYGIGIQATGLIFGMASAIIFPNIMGKDEFGYFTLAIALASACLVFTDAGINQVAVKFVSEGSKTGRARAYYDLLFRNKAILSIAVSILVFLLADIIALSVFNMPGAGDGFRAAAFVLFFWSFATYFENVLFSLMGAMDVLVANFVYNFMRLAIPILFYIYLFPKQWAWAVAGVAFAVMLYCPLLFLKVRNRLPKEKGRGKLELKELNNYWKYSFLGYVGAVLFMNLDLIIVGFSQGPEKVAAYRVAMMWITSITVFSAAANKIFFSAHARESDERSRSIVSRAIKYAFVGSMLAVAGLALLSSKLLTLLYSGKYADAYQVMAILGLIVLETTLNSITVPVLLGKGKIELQTMLALATGIVQLIAMLILTPIYGIVGMALVVVGVRLPFAFLTCWYTTSLLKARIPVLHYAVPILTALALYFVFAPYASGAHSIPEVVLMGAGVVTVYSLVMVVFRVITIGEIGDLVKQTLG